MTLQQRVLGTFFAVLVIVLGGVGTFVYLGTRDAIDSQIDRQLRQARAQVAVLGQRGGSGLSQVDSIASAGTFAQVLRPDGSVEHHTTSVSGLPVVKKPGTYEIRDPTSDTEATTRVLAESDFFINRLIVVGVSLSDRDAALRRLLLVLVLGGLAGLVLTVYAGYRAIYRALAPVEAMRRQAQRMEGHERLPVPKADDELRRLGQTLNGLLARQEEALGRERRLLDDASHELRTPLQLLRTELELALRQGGDPQAALASSLEEVERLIDLAEQLLVTARAGETVARQEIDAGELLQDISARFTGTAGARRIEVEAPPGVRLHGDRTLLTRALTNLVDNALRHGEGTVTLRALGNSLQVSDEGPGFDPAFVPRAFDRLSRGDAARTSTGAGLGLAIVEAVARAHGGSASIDGATVNLTLGATVPAESADYAGR